MSNFKHPKSTRQSSIQDEQDVPSEGRKGSASEYGNREEKLADEPKFRRKNERPSARELDENARRNRGLWKDPDPDLSGNQARAAVYGSGEDNVDGAGERINEDEHEIDPGIKHYGNSPAELAQFHQDRIIDKHAPAESIFQHKKGSKAAYALAPESKVESTLSKRN